jgi:hypothetical protein
MVYNPIFDLTNQDIENTYQQVTQYDTGSSTFYNGQGQSLLTTSSFASQSISSSFATNAGTASFLTFTPVNALTASYAVLAVNAISSSWAGTSSFAVTTSFARNANSSSFATSASFATTSSFEFQSVLSITSSWASQSLSSSYAQTASFALNSAGGGATSSYFKGIYGDVIYDTPSNTGAGITFSSSNGVTINTGDNGSIYLGFAGQMVGVGGVYGNGFFNSHPFGSIIQLGDFAGGNNGTNLQIDDSFLHQWIITSKMLGVKNSTPVYALDVGGPIGNSVAGNPYFIYDGTNADNNGNANTYFSMLGGNVGIGINNPTNSLDVNGNISCSVLTASICSGQAGSSNNNGNNLTIQAGRGGDASPISGDGGNGGNVTILPGGYGNGQDGSGSFGTITIGTTTLDGGNDGNEIIIQNGGNANIEINAGIGAGQNAGQIYIQGGANSDHYIFGGSNSDIYISGSRVHMGTNVSISSNGLLTPTHPLEVVGAISASVVTASLFYGTASFANTASYLSGTTSSAAPGNTTTPVTWSKVTMNGQTFFLALYQ